MRGAELKPGKSVRPYLLWGLWMGVLCFLVLAAGCAAPRPMTIGYRTSLQNLDRLISEKSSVVDVREALGQGPRGHGSARFSRDQPLRKVWFYEFMQIKGDQVSVSILLIFFREDRYDGYLWFSAKELLR